MIGDDEAIALTTDDLAKFTASNGHEAQKTTEEKYVKLYQESELGNEDFSQWIRVIMPDNQANHFVSRQDLPQSFLSLWDSLYMEGTPSSTITARAPPVKRARLSRPLGIVARTDPELMRLERQLSDSQERYRKLLLISRYHPRIRQLSPSKRMTSKGKPDIRSQNTVSEEEKSDKTIKEVIIVDELQKLIDRWKEAGVAVISHLEQLTGLSSQSILKSVGASGKLFDLDEEDEDENNNNNDDDDYVAEDENIKVDKATDYGSW